MKTLKALKAFLKSGVLAILVWCARARLARMRARGVRLIGVTGSIGKTTCKEAIAHVLKGICAHVLCSKKSYNTEFGLPLTILELESEFSSVVGWMRNIILAFGRGVLGVGRGGVTYNFLVLEMGVDKPGDMEQLLNVLNQKSRMRTESAVPLHCAVFTGVHPVHMADGQFETLDAIAEEKGKILSAVKTEKDGGTLLVCADDERVMEEVKKMAGRINVAGGKNVIDVKDLDNTPKIVPFGVSENAKLHVGDVSAGWEGVRFTARYGEGIGEFEVPILGEQHVGSLLPAIGVGLAMGMYMNDIVARMKTFRLPPGRLSLIEAKNDAWILDSSYNASPDATKAAVTTMEELAVREMKNGWRVKRKIFVFGNMNELGSRSEEEHRGIGRFLLGDGGLDILDKEERDYGKRRRKIDMLITVGEFAKMAGDELQKIIKTREKQGDGVHNFQTAEQAADFLETQIQSGDLILVKGSQNNVRLEKLVKRLMRAPEQAPELLVRQDFP